MKADNTKFYGYKGYVAAVIVMIASYGVTAALPIFMPAISVELGIDAASVGLMLTVSSAVTFVLTFLCGWIIRRLRLKASFLLGMLLVCLPCYLFAISKSLSMLLIASAIQGLAGAVAINVCITALIKNWFLEKRGALIGYAFCGSSIGSSVFLYLGGVLIERYSWQTAYAIIGTVCLVIGVAASLFIKNDPESVGQRPLGNPDYTEEDIAVIRSGLTIKEALGNAQFWLILIVVTVFNIFIMALPTFAASFWVEAGMDIVLAGTLLTVATIACAVSTFFSGKIADKWGNKAYVTYLHAAYVLSAIFTVLSIGTLNPLYIGGSLLFLVIGIPLYTSMMPTITFELFGSRDYEKISGFFQGGINIGLMLMSPVCAVVLSRFGSFKMVFVLGLAVCLVSFLVILLSLRRAPAAGLGVSGDIKVSAAD